MLTHVCANTNTPTVCIFCQNIRFSRRNCAYGRLFFLRKYMRAVDGWAVCVCYGCTVHKVLHMLTVRGGTPTRHGHTTEVGVRNGWSVSSSLDMRRDAANSDSRSWSRTRECSRKSHRHSANELNVGRSTYVRRIRQHGQTPRRNANISARCNSTLCTTHTNPDAKLALVNPSNITIIIVKNKTSAHSSGVDATHRQRQCNILRTRCVVVDDVFDAESTLEFIRD